MFSWKEFPVYLFSSSADIDRADLSALIKTEKEYSQSKLGKQGNISLLSEEAGKTGAVNSAL